MKLLAVLPTLFPAIQAAILTAESLTPEGGKGEYKLRLVLEIIKAGIDASKDGKIGWDDVAPFVTQLVQLTVAYLNATGAFKKSA